MTARKRSADKARRRAYQKEFNPFFQLGTSNARSMASVGSIPDEEDMSA